MKGAPVGVPRPIIPDRAPIRYPAVLRIQTQASGTSRPSSTAPGVLARIGRGVDALAAHYERALGATLYHTRGMLAVALLLVVAGVLAYHAVGTGFLPEMDEGAFVLDYFSPGGTALAETDRMVHEVERILTATPEVATTSRVAGSSRRT